MPAASERNLRDDGRLSLLIAVERAPGCASAAYALSASPRAIAVAMCLAPPLASRVAEMARPVTTISATFSGSIVRKGISKGPSVPRRRLHGQAGARPCLSVVSQ